VGRGDAPRRQCLGRPLAEPARDRPEGVGQRLVAGRVTSGQVGGGRVGYGWVSSGWVSGGRVGYGWVGYGWVGYGWVSGGWVSGLGPGRFAAVGDHGEYSSSLWCYTLILR